MTVGRARGSLSVFRTGTVIRVDIRDWTPTKKAPPPPKYNNIVVRRAHVAQSARSPKAGDTVFIFTGVPVGDCDVSPLIVLGRSSPRVTVSSWTATAVVILKTNSVILKNYYKRNPIVWQSIFLNCIKYYYRVRIWVVLLWSFGTCIRYTLDARLFVVHMLGEQGVTVGSVTGFGRPEDEYASENAKNFTVDSLLQINRPDAAVVNCKLPANVTPNDGGKTS